MGVRICIQSVKHMWLWQVFEHQSNRNGANVLFHQLKLLYHVVVCVECYAVLKSACFWCRYMFKMLVLCVSLLDVFVHLCSKCYKMW